MNHRNSKPIVLTDLGEVCFLKLRGVCHSNLQFISEREVGFIFNNVDLDDLLSEYWQDRATIPPRLFKTTLDSYKRLIFSFLRNKR